MIRIGQLFMCLFHRNAIIQCSLRRTDHLGIMVPAVEQLFNFLKIKCDHTNLFKATVIQLKHFNVNPISK